MPKLVELVQPPKEPVPEVVEILETLLAKAKAGEIWELAVCYVTDDEVMRDHSIPCPVHADMLIGAMFRLSMDLARPEDED